MKTTLIALALFIGASSAYSQGRVFMGDYGLADFQITVWSPQLSGSPLSGNSSAAFGQNATGTQDTPSGTQDGYTGTPLGGSSGGPVTPTDYTSGNLWSVQLYAAPGVGASANTLVPVAGTSANFFQNSSVVGFPGEWDEETTATIDTANDGFNVAVGSPATLAIAAWYNGNGAYTSYEAAMAAGVPAGMSSTGSEDLGGTPVAVPDLPGPGESQTLSGGIQSFSVAAVPEPSTIALGVMGASALLLRLRRKV